MYLTNFLGNSRLLKKIQSDAHQNRTSHAIILEGAAGSGKHTIAEYIALTLACENSPDVCGQCPACRKIISKNSPDVIYVSPEEGRVQILVDNIRFVRSDVYVKPNDNRYKVYIIEQSDKMTEQAQNAFLKVLEEPPSYAVFILLCESADSLLITIKSRCAVYTTERFDIDTLSEYLINSSESAKALADSSPESFKLALKTSGGAVGKALLNINSETAEYNLSIYKSASELLVLLRRRASAFDIQSHLLSLEQSKSYFDFYLSTAEAALFDIISCKLSDHNFTPTFYLDENELEYISAGFTKMFILETIELFEKYRFALNTNVNLQTTITAMSSELAVIRNKY